MFFAMLELGFIIRRLNMILNKIPIRLKIKSTYSVLKKPNRKDGMAKNIVVYGTSHVCLVSDKKHSWIVPVIVSKTKYRLMSSTTALNIKSLQ